MPNIVKNECLYGWYPPAKSIYKKPRIQSGYEKEALFRHWNSRFNDHPGVSTPDPPTPVRINLSPRPDRRQLATAGGGVRINSQGSRSATPVIARPKSTLSLDLHIPKAQPCKTPTARTAWCSEGVEVTDPVYQPPAPPSGGPSPCPKPERVRSAPMQRPRSQIPPRPVKSAGPRRSFPTSPEQRPIASAPPSGDLRHDSAVPGPVLDYDEQLQTHGWRMQVHGDPLGLKAPCLIPRLPYTVKIKEPEVPPNPPRGRIENYETYFYNTIPRKPLSYVIHKEWVSEVLHAKRMELQQRDGIHYKHTNYAFAY